MTNLFKMYYHTEECALELMEEMNEAWDYSIQFEWSKSKYSIEKHSKNCKLKEEERRARKEYEEKNNETKYKKGGLFGAITAPGIDL